MRAIVAASERELQPETLLMPVVAALWSSPAPRRADAPQHCFELEAVYGDDPFACGSTISPSSIRGQMNIGIQRFNNARRRRLA